MQPSAFVRRAAGGFGLGLLTAGLVVLPSTSASAVSTTLVINEVYVNGGSAGATYTHKYVELLNTSATDIPLSGLSLQYRAPSASGASGTVVALQGTVPAGGYFTVRGGSNGSNGLAVPGVDQTSSLNPGAGGGTITLATGTAAVDPSTSTSVLDKVGWGSSNAPERAATTGNTVTQSLSRIGADTDNNAYDFTATNPTPDAVNPTVAPREQFTGSIADIQGTDAATSPREGDIATTTGVVTAAYATGGFDGFYIQTGGDDTTPGASDGIFVHDPGFPAAIAVGDSVEVKGLVQELDGLTRLAAESVTELTTALPAAVANSVIPGTDCALPGDSCLSGAALDAAREEFEGEAFQPSAPMTVTDAYDFGVTSSSFFGEIGIAANSRLPLITPTEVIDAQDTAGIAARTAYNNAHRVVLDDGSTTAYWNTSNNAAGQDGQLPWLTADHTVRVGASVSFDQPAILDYRFGWKLQPQRQVVGVPTGLVTFEQDRPAAPAAVGGDLKMATFNVLNYFTTFGADVVGCEAYVDRAGDGVATRRCSGANGPRGAWEQEDFERQQAKIVNAINTMDADIVALEELENSLIVDGHDRDEAAKALVAALNAAAGTTRWAHVPSPAGAPTDDDVIRNGFIYDPATVALVGDSVIHDAPAFDNARDPLAQAFKPKNGTAAQTFAVIVNHFKSKGSGVDDGTGQGRANPDRVAQAQSLVEFGKTFGDARRTNKTFLVGDFNAYSKEDPVQVIEGAGYTAMKSTDDPNEESYSFSGTSGSLDHVFANAAAAAMVTGVDIWEINANESVYYQYSRHNYTGTDLYRPYVYASSDHNPEVVGIKVPATAPVPEVAARVTPDPIIVDRTRAVVRAKVTLAGKDVTTGTVEVSFRGRLLGTAPVVDGVATIKLPRFRDKSTDLNRDYNRLHVLDVSYVGDDGVSYTTEEVTVRVRKAISDIRVLRAGGVAGKTAVLRIKVRDLDAKSGVARGWARIKFNREWHTMKLRDGRASWSLGRLAPQTRKVVVRYNGNNSTRTDRQVAKLRITRG